MRVVVLGAGYAGLTVARRLESRLPDAAELVVVDESDAHLVQHELHRLVRRPALVDAVRVPLADALDRAAVRRARVEAVDRDARRVDLGDDRLSYDYLVLCLGARTAFYGLPGVEERATPLKRVAHAERVREDFLDLADAPDARVVVGGAGLSGVQVAGELAALGEEDGVDAEVRLLERERAVAPTFPEQFQRAVRDELEARGVAVETGARVTGATDEAVCLDGRTDVACDQLVWTGGIRGPEATGGDRPVVRADLRLDDRAFAVGDVARVVDADGEAVPASAAAAVREARTAATNVARLVEHDLDGDADGPPRLDAYRFDVPGWIVSVGDGAVAQVGPTVLRGAPARAMKATVGAGHLGSVGAVRRATELVESELR
ncbi:MAG: NAD(P)/FAD-dependent oxidoreductase [Haloferacaceae archaeon]